MIDKTKIDLNLPAWGVGSQKVADLEPKQESVEPADAEPKEVKEEVEETPVESSDEEPAKVKYSRFKTVHTRALEAEKEAAHWREEAERLRSTRRDVESPTSDLPDYWREMYGDSDASKKAWNIQRQQNEQLKAEAREEALLAVKEERRNEALRTNENVETIDNSFESLSDLVGRDLTAKEQSAVLDIVDEFTPKDEDGNYMGPLIPFEKAWEYYEVKNQISKAPKKESRDAVASLNSSRSEGEPTVDAKKSENWNPFDWNSYKKRL